MRKFFISAFAVASLAAAPWAAATAANDAAKGVEPTFTEWHDLGVNQINRFQCHTSYFAYESAEAARRGDMK